MGSTKDGGRLGRSSGGGMAMGGAPPCSSANIRSIAARSRRDSCAPGCILLPPDDCRPGSYIAPIPGDPRWCQRVRRVC